MPRLYFSSRYTPLPCSGKPMGESIPAPTGTPHSPQALRWITRHPEVELSFPAELAFSLRITGFPGGNLRVMCGMRIFQRVAGTVLRLKAPDAGQRVWRTQNRSDGQRVLWGLAREYPRPDRPGPGYARDSSLCQFPTSRTLDGHYFDNGGGYYASLRPR